MAEELLHDIPIRFVNKTGKSNFSVAVFAENLNPDAKDTPYVCWLSLRTQTSATFTYPMETQIGAEYEKDGVQLMAGPVPANVGSTWEFLHEKPDSTPYLKEGKRL